jgi:hypothetical protein
VQPFPGPGGKRQVSTNGGTQARWRKDGKELFYIGLDTKLMAVPISISARRDAFEPSLPIAFTPEDSSPSPIMLILKWKPGREK